MFLVLAVPTGCLGPNYWEAIGGYLLYGLSLMSLSYFISTLFDVPKSGADMSVFLNLIGSILIELLLIDYV